MCAFCCSSVFILAPAGGTRSFLSSDSLFPPSLFPTFPLPLTPSPSPLLKPSLCFYIVLSFFSSFVSHQELIAVTHTSAVFVHGFFSPFFWLSEEDKKTFGRHHVCVWDKRGQWLSRFFPLGFCRAHFLIGLLTFCVGLPSLYDESVLARVLHFIFYFFLIGTCILSRKGLSIFLFQWLQHVAFFFFFLHLEPNIQSCFFSTSFCHSHRIPHDKKKNCKETSCKLSKSGTSMFRLCKVQLVKHCSFVFEPLSVFSSHLCKYGPSYCKMCFQRLCNNRPLFFHKGKKWLLRKARVEAGHLLNVYQRFKLMGSPN